MTQTTIPCRTASGDSCQLWRDFNRICDFGGRLAGTESEQAALAFLEEAGREASGVAPQLIPVPYEGWHSRRTQLRLPDGSVVPCHALLRSAATGPEGLEAEVVDLGRGTPEEFAARSADIAGRIVLVRHELMFSAETIHRRLKYTLAMQHGARGFLIGGPLSGQVVAGSSGTEATRGIPAAGISPETAALLTHRVEGYPTVRLLIETEHMLAETKTLLFDMPGQSDEWVVLSAHVDGHDLAESAIDNGSGLAVALAVVRQIAPEIARNRRGLRLAFFSVEEWALTGSAVYVEGLSQAERARIALNINLDSVAGSPDLTALTSGFGKLEPFLLASAKPTGRKLEFYLPLQMNSDHGNFAQAGIPAFRLVAGFNNPAAATRHVLTPADTRDKVQPCELEDAANLVTAIVRDSLEASPETVSGWRNL